MSARPHFLLLALAIAGCAGTAPVAPVAIPAAAEPTVAATGYLTPRGSDGRLLALVNAWTVADIDHVVLTVSVGGSTVGTLTILHANLTNQVTIGNLKRNTNYAILAQAYNTSDSSAPIDNSGVLLSSCTTTFSTTTDSTASIGPIALQLANKTFAGSGGNTLNIVTGSVVSTTNTFSVGLASLISTFAGNGTGTFAGDNGQAASASIKGPYGLNLDGSGNLFICDHDNNRVRKVDHTTGTITTIAGTGAAAFGGDNSAATGAQLDFPFGVVVDGLGNVYIGDQFNHRVRRVDHTTNIITTYAGNGTPAFGGDNGAATSASLQNPSGLALDASGNLIIADGSNHRIRKVDHTTGVITTIAGNGTGTYSGDNVLATSTSLRNPVGVALDGSGNIFIADTANHRVRRVDHTTNLITTVAGTGTATYNGDGVAATSASLSSPQGLAVDVSGNLLIADSGNHRVRKVDHTTNVITTIAGTGTAAFGGDGGAAASAALSFPTSVAVEPGGTVYVADHDNHRIRKIQ